jgi:hypothetical protein
VRFWEPLEEEMSGYVRTLDELVSLLDAAQAVAHER